MTKILVSQTFESFEQLADLAVSWQADFCQLSVERTKAVIFQAQVGSLLISSARFGCFVEQRGTTPEGMRTFAVFHHQAPQANWFGNTVGPGALLVFPEAGEIDVISRPGFCAFTISLSVSGLKKKFARYTMDDPDTLLGSGELVIQMTVGRFNRLHGLLDAMRQVAGSNADMFLTHIRQQELEELFVQLLFEVLTDKSYAKGVVKSERQYALKRVLDYSRAHANEALSVSQLSQIARVSERTLQYVFKRELGMTPKSFLLGQRLYSTHRELWRATTSRTSVSKTANNWGFSHLGQFAADYRRLFGELPSVTLRRSAPPFN